MKRKHETSHNSTIETVNKYITLNNCQTVLRAFFMGHGLLQATLESGNHLMKTQILEIMCEMGELQNFI